MDLQTHLAISIAHLDIVIPITFLGIYSIFFFFYSKLIHNNVSFYMHPLIDSPFVVFGFVVVVLQRP